MKIEPCGYWKYHDELDCALLDELVIHDIKCLHIERLDRDWIWVGVYGEGKEKLNLYFRPGADGVLDWWFEVVHEEREVPPRQ